MELSLGIGILLKVRIKLQIEWYIMHHFSDQFQFINHALVAGICTNVISSKASCVGSCVQG